MYSYVYIYAYVRIWYPNRHTPYIYIYIWYMWCLCVFSFCALVDLSLCHVCLLLVCPMRSFWYVECVCGLYGYIMICIHVLVQQYQFPSGRAAQQARAGFFIRLQTSGDINRFIKEWSAALGSPGGDGTDSYSSVRARVHITDALIYTYIQTYKHA